MSEWLLAFWSRSKGSEKIVIAIAAIIILLLVFIVSTKGIASFN